MKKLFNFLFVFALLVLLFTACQSKDSITSPVSELEKPSSVYTFYCDPTKIADETVNLIAGQHNPVGTATFHKTTSGLEINYQLNSVVINSGAKITEVHIDFATTLNNNSKNGGFHANNSGNPQPGQFDLNVPISGSGVTNWSTTISNETLAGYLNTTVVPADFYIAAHGVVTYPDQSGAGNCPDLPNGKWRYLVEGKWWGVSHYVEGMKIYDTNDLNSQLLYDNISGWCVDRQRGVTAGNSWNQVDFLCSTSPDTAGKCLVEKIGNLAAVNWLLNNKTYSGTPSMMDLQVTIWKLVSNETDYSEYTYNAARVEALYNAALTHTDFVPGCGQIIGVLMFSTDIDYCNGDRGVQVLLVEQFVQCGAGGSETMWGFDWDFNNQMPLDNYSCRFVDQGNWARYFKF